TLPHAVHRRWLRVRGHGEGVGETMAIERPQVKKAVLAYSGGLDTSVIIPWLREHYGCDVIAVCGDLGQEEELEGLGEKAVKTGASKAYIEDLREEFVADYIFPVLRSGAIYE